jgi:hypothetical protein
MVSDRVAAALARMDGDGGDGGEQPNSQAHGHRLKLSPSQVAASSVAACSSALVASFLGVAGTIGGAAIGSVVATTGTAVYGHALRRGGTKIAERLGPDAVVADEAESETAPRTQAGIALTPEADGLAGAIERATSPGPSRTPPKTGYRKSIALAVAMLAVFGAAITVGLLAGGPIRQAGTGYNFTRPQTVTQGPSASPSTGSPTATTTTSPSASTSATASSSAPTPSSSSAATSQGTASQPPTG